MSFHFVSNRLSSKVREAKLDGRDHLVIPTTLIVPGVLNGSGGAGYYPAEEVKASVRMWNHIPLVAPDHPVVNGNHVSARNAEVLDRYGVGIVLNSRIDDDGKLQGESWIDVNKADRVDPKLIWSLRLNKDVEVSTGLDLKVTNGNGEYNGKAFNWTGSAYRPDHLALLTNSVGACSLKDGCGLHVNQLTFDQINRQLSMELRKFHSPMLSAGADDFDVYLITATSTYAIYMVEGVMMKMTYTKKNDELQLSGSPVKVKEKVTYVEVSNVADPESDDSSKGKPTMEKTKLIDGIINSGCDCWGEDDRSVLEGFTEDKLTGIANSIAEGEKHKKVFNALQNGVSDDTVEVKLNDDSTGIVFNAKPKKEKKEEETVGNNAAKIDFDQLPDSLQRMVNSFNAQQKSTVDSQIEAILNSRPEAERDALRADLSSLSEDAVKMMFNMLPKKETADYSGASPSGSTSVNNKSDLVDDEPLTVANFNFGGEA